MFFEILLLTLALLFIHHWLSRPKGLPPGPQSFPIIGSGLVLDFEKIKEYKKKYGDIFRCELAGVTCIYVCDYKLMKEAMSKFADRPQFKAFHIFTNGTPQGLTFVNGQRWTNIRRFVSRNLKDLGMGKSSLDTAIIHEARCLVEEFKKLGEKPSTFPEYLDIAILNVIWQMVASHRYNAGDSEARVMSEAIKELKTLMVGGLLLELYPALKVLPDFIKDFIFKTNKATIAVNSAIMIVKGHIATHKANLDSSLLDNVIDQYLVQKNNETDTAKFFSDLDLQRLLIDLFIGGSETVSIFIRWILLYAAKYQDVQKRIQNQIDEVVPRGEYPANHHRAQIPLLEAFIYEVLRCSSIFHYRVPRSSSTDFSLGNYLIPKNSVVFWVSGCSHQDAEIWDKPEEFRPERFLDDEGCFVSPKKGFAIFGLGKRSCIGESLARMELYIFTAALLQNFTLSPPEGKTIDLSRPDPLNPHVTQVQDIIAYIRK